MNKTNKKTYEKNRILPLVAIAVSAVALVTAVVSVATSGTKAKYTEAVPKWQVALTVNAELAASLEVKEHQLTGDYYDEYELSSDTLVESNAYVLMPGVSIPKDPKVYVTGKTSIPAYLYVEVVDSTDLVTSGENAAFVYSLTDDWTKLTEVTGKNGGEVYVYNTVLQTEGENVQDFEIPILTGNTITVTEKLNTGSGYSGSLTFYAYMAQAVDGKTADEIFRTQLAS